MPHTIVLPLLGSLDPERVVATACALAGEDGTVDAVVVIEISPLLPLDARMDAEEVSARMLHARAREAASAILELAEREDAEIVVAECDGRRLPRPARRLVRRAPDRVLIV